MHEPTLNQAAGLMAMGHPRGARLMAMVSHGDERVELPVLWQLCMALSELGYAVTVLDATVCETSANPGLEQMLDFSYWQVTHEESRLWTVIPSALGLQSLCASSDRDSRLGRLGRVIPGDGAVILYSNAEWLSLLLGNSSAAPLLAVSSMKTSLMTSYLALKRLIKNGDLEPTIVNLAHDERAVSASLGVCARNFLGYEVKPISIATPSIDNRPREDVQRLALRLLESALFVSNSDRRDPSPYVPTRISALGQGARSH